MARNTVQQAVIESALHKLGNHPTAEEVYNLVATTYPSIGKATVYRTLNKLVENGRALKVPISNGADRFDHRSDSHYHIQCMHCGRVDDLDVAIPADLCQQVAVSSDYAVQSLHVHFCGVCPQCAQLPGRGEA